MIVRNKIIVIFLLIYCHKHLQSNGHKSDNSSLNALLQFISLTESKCTFIDWCSIRKQGDIGVNKVSSIRCCPSCSCKSTCLRDNTCCPDFELSMFLGGRIYSNFSNLVAELDQTNYLNVAEQMLTNYSNNVLELAAELNQLNYSDVLHIAAGLDQTNNSNGLDLAAELGQTNDFSNIEYLNPILKQSTKCLCSSLLGCGRIPSLESMYLMVSTCIDSNVIPENKQQCESLAKFSPESTIKDYVPVQSLASGNVYRNIHCFRCSNETSARYAEWDAILTGLLNSQMYLQYQMLSIVELFAYALSSKNSAFDRSNIRFEPTESLRNAYPPKTCHMIDVNTCNVSRTIASKVLQYACHQYVLPVHWIVNGNRIVFNNLACVYCHGLMAADTDGEAICKHDIHVQNVTTFLGKINIQYAENIGRKDISVNDKINNNTINDKASGLKSTPCRKNSVYDNTNICRKLHCPGGMVEYGETCVPILGTIQGKVYDIQLTVIPTDWTTGERRNTTHFELELLNYINNYFKIGSRFTIQFVGLWKSEIKAGYKVDYFVKLLFAGLATDITYLEVVTMIDKAFRGTKEIITKPVHTMVDISLNGIIPHGRDIFDITTKRIYKLVYPSVIPNFPQSHTLLPITEGNFCYRIELLPSDIAEIKGRNLILKYTRKIILPINLYSYLTNASRYFVCAEHLLGKNIVKSSLNTNIDNKKADTMEDENRDKQHDNVNSKDIENMISLTIVVVCLIIIFGAIICMKRYAKRRPITGQHNTNEIELADVNT